MAKMVLAEVDVLELEKIEEYKNTFYKIKKIIYFASKRIFDILCALIGLLALLPIALITKICYLATGDTKSIFYKQQRIGKNGEKIHIFKFRSMIHNAEEVLTKLLENPEYKEEWQTSQKLKNDPRITKIGKILRKTSLDELPQFINVIKGEMSLIGPRPLVEGELDAHKGNHKLYESVRPGISGWWGANGRSCVDYSKRLDLEYFYCRNCGFVLDIKCIFLTIKAVLSRNGAK